MPSPRFLAFAGMLVLGAPCIDAASISLAGYASGDTFGSFNIAPGISVATVSSPYASGGVLSGSTDNPIDTYYYSFNASGTPGLLHLSVEASNSNDDVTDPPPSGGAVNGIVVMSLSTTDFITIGGMSHGTFQFSYLFDGSEACVGNLATCTTAGGFNLNGNGLTIASVNSQGSGSPFFEATVDVPFSSGGVGIGATLTEGATCYTSYGGDCTALVNFSNTAMLGDAVVLDSNGNIVPDATITSQSGYDYTQSLVESTPEPGTLGMIVFGLTALAFGLRRRLIL
jgi:hypothetical protein